MDILVTGGAGFIGSHTCECLLRAGHKVRVFDNMSTGKLSNLKEVRADVDLREADIRDYESLADSCRGMDAVIHLAAVSSVEKSLAEPRSTQHINAGGTLNMIQAAGRQDVRRIVFSSSAAVYGNHPELPKRENSPTQPLSPYGWQKVTGEFYGSFFCRIYRNEFTALRYFNVYGPRQDPSSPYSGVLSIFADKSLRGEPLIIQGDGLQTRDFIHVLDIAEVNLRAVEAGPTPPNILNIATGIETSINHVAEMISTAAAQGSEIRHAAARDNDIHRSFAGIDLMKTYFDYTATIEMNKGVLDLL
ncbi:UDP-glucose 4-epimerase [bacterium BMS3Abin01]|nr:UDP-glucose 4-epimerase [bacterium BMS3Abin01]HDZ59435.1 NAD-dependent epimerase/dehydratase family protein [Actinomycetota bacterium]